MNGLREAMYGLGKPKPAIVQSTYVEPVKVPLVRVVRHYKGRRYVVHYDPYSAAYEAVKAYHDLLGRLRTAVEISFDSGMLNATVSAYFTDDKAG